MIGQAALTTAESLIVYLLYVLGAELEGQGQKLVFGGVGLVFVIATFEAVNPPEMFDTLAVGQ